MSNVVAIVCRALMDATASDAFSLTGKSKTGLKRRFKGTELYKVVIGKFPV